MIGPPSYVVAQDAGTEAVSGGDSAATTASTIIATTKPILDASSTRKAAPPVPHFDSVLRAAPALDDDFDLEEIAESASSSTLSLPDQLTASEGSSLQTLLRPHIEHHASLHAYLDANSMLQEFILQTRESIHIDAGKVKSSHSKVSRLEKDLGSVRLEAEKKGKLFWSPKRRREWRRRMAEVESELQIVTAAWHISERDLQEDREKLRRLEEELIEYGKVQDRLDALDDEIFCGTTHGHSEEDELEQRYHVLTETQKRLLSAVQLETRAQGHLNKALRLCNELIAELLVGLSAGIDAGIPTNQKHRTQMWKGTSRTFSARTARGHVLRAKTIVGELHTTYILSRAVQKRVVPLSRLEVIELNRLPGMNAKNVVDEAGFHRSLETSYAQSKAAKAHITTQVRLSRDRQASIKRNIKDLQVEARQVWLQLRQARREIVEANKEQEAHVTPLAALSVDTDRLPPYKRRLVSSSTVGPIGSKSTGGGGGGLIGNEISLPRAFRRRVDRESMERTKMIVRRVAIEVGGMLEEDNVAEDERLAEEEDLPGFELSFK